MLIEMVIIGTMTVTSYRPIPEQTKPTCIDRHHCETSIGENVSELGVAVSEDLLLSGKVHYRDVLFIPGIGYRIVFDVMNKRHKNSIDIFVYDYSEEKAIGVRHIPVSIIRGPHAISTICQSRNHTKPQITKK